jgi:hypothetical protein
MKKAIVVTCVVAAVVAAAPCLAQDALDGWEYDQKHCSPLGSWYGGGENPDGTGIKYLLTVSRGHGNRLVAEARGAYKADDLGWPVFTAWTGELVKLSGSRYEVFLINLAGGDVTFPPVELPGINAVRGVMEVVDCTTLSIEHTFFGIYLWGQVPFVDEPVGQIPTPIYETFWRMPTEWPPEWMLDSQQVE